MIQNLIDNSSKVLAALIDPDKADSEYLADLIKNDKYFDFYFVGGSLVSDYQFDQVCMYLKRTFYKTGGFVSR